MKQISLNGIWELNYSDKKSKWLNARVPGDVHMDLIKAGVIDEPLRDNKTEKCRWMEDKKWLYRKKFSILEGFKRDRVELLFEGLDITAEIWLNGKKIGYHNNAFIDYRIDVTDKINAGDNILAVKLDCGIKSVKNKPLRKYGVPRGHWLLNERIWIRKPQFVFGWSWAPRLVTCGIWRPVSLLAYDKIAIRNVFIYSKLARNSADVYLTADIENFLKQKISVNLDTSLKNSNRKHTKVQNIILKPGLNKFFTKLHITNPKLWWPKPLGKPNLYDFKLKITKSNQLLDEFKTRVGIREIKLLQEPLPEPEGGKSFTFAINNKKVFCNGANWVPAESILASVTKEKYEKMIELAANANFNMLRVWGGGIYEDDYFYRLCDEHGIMIWQDFMFACGLYPDDDRKFLEEVKRELTSAVKKLRNHACIVCWCGNNENDWHYDPAPDNLFKGARKFYGGKIYHKILPEICKIYDPTKPYWPSSPYGGENPNSEQEGDHHFYYISSFGGGHLRDTYYELFSKISAKFVSEYGFHALPAKNTLRKYVPLSRHLSKSKSLGSKVTRIFSYLQKRISKYFKIDIDSTTLGELAILSQFLQAEGLKYAIEHFRRRKFFCSGTLFWMYADCCPYPRWSSTVIDYYLNTKPSYYYVKRAHEPIHVTIKEEDCGVSVWLINDTLKEIRGIIECKLQKFNGEIIKFRKKHVKVKPDSSQIILQDRIEPFGKNCFYYAKFIVRNKTVSENRHFFVRFKELTLPETKLTCSLKKTQRNNKYMLRLKSDYYALMVQLDLPQGIECDNNYFDILPGETKKVLLAGDSRLIKRMKIHALNKK